MCQCRISRIAHGDCGAACGCANAPDPGKVVAVVQIIPQGSMQEEIFEVTQLFQRLSGTNCGSREVSSAGAGSAHCRADWYASTTEHG